MHPTFDWTRLPSVWGRILGRRSAGPVAGGLADGLAEPDRIGVAYSHLPDPVGVPHLYFLNGDGGRMDRRTATVPAKSARPLGPVACAAAGGCAGAGGH